MSIPKKDSFEDTSAETKDPPNSMDTSSSYIYDIFNEDCSDSQENSNTIESSNFFDK